MDHIRLRIVFLVMLLLAAFSSAGLAGAECPLAFQRGDANRDNRLDLSDPIATLGFLFLGKGELGCLDAADADDNGKIDLSDAVFTVGYLFLGRDPIPPPTLGHCGIDSTADALTCLEYPPCGVAADNSCTSNDCCALGSYCEKAENDCDGIGVCTVRPDVCPRLFDPWCGCDGVTYGNRCEASAAGVNVIHRGPCANPNGCTSDNDCALDSYCAKAEGACADSGVCAVKPDACPKILDPVCGCDAVTYQNDCEAARQGVSIDYRGECKHGTPCASNGECDPMEYCVKILGRCDEPGVCQSRPDLCAQIFIPVCGCDGVTYGNDCIAGQAGVSVAHEGTCDAGAACKSNADCDADSYCATADGFCGEPGSCRKTTPPADCVDLPADPVCGCDGNTYRTSCLAAAAGVNVLRPGACQEGVECKSNFDCDEPLFCSKKLGFCVEPGICITDPAPADCQDLPEKPICGCDDKTYRTECEANLNGISVAYEGACDGIPRCGSNDDCPADSYCEFLVGFCGGLGKCAVRPADCPKDLVDPICGCDGRSYQNACFAAMAGVSVSSSRKCELGGVECQTNATCGGGSFCGKPDGDCDGTGECAALPTNCDDTVDLVCGCDGITYTNECQAHAAGVNVLEKGRCPQ